MGKGSGTNTVQTQSGPPQQVLDAYTQAWQNAQNVANQPYQGYQGQIVAGFTPDQLTAMGLTEGAQGMAQPYITSASQYAQAATNPIWGNNLPGFGTRGTNAMGQSGLGMANTAFGYAGEAGATGEQLQGNTQPYLNAASGIAGGMPGQMSPYTRQASGLAAGVGGLAGSIPGALNRYTNQVSYLNNQLPGQVGGFTQNASQLGESLANAGAGYAQQASGFAGQMPGTAGRAANQASLLAGQMPGTAALSAGQMSALAGQMPEYAGQAAGQVSGLAGQMPGVAGQAAQQISGLANQMPGVTGQAAQQIYGLAGQMPGVAGQAARQIYGLAGQMPGVAGQAAQQASALAGQMPGVAGQAAQQVSGLAGQIQGGLSPYANAAAQPITMPGYDQLSTYLSPYTQNVVQTTQAEFANQNAQQQQQIQGDAAMRGAFGGDREAVAQGIAAGQEQLAQAPVIAGLEQSGFQQAQQELNTQQQAELQRQQEQGQLQLGAGNLVLGGYGQAGQLGLGAGQLGLSGLQGAGQLGISAGQLGLSGLQGAGQLGATAGQLGLSGLEGAGQLGATAGQLGLSGLQGATQAQLGAGQLGLSGLQGATQAQLGAGQLGLSGMQGATQAQMGAGQLGLSGLQGAGQLGISAGQLGLSGLSGAGQLALGAGQEMTGAAGTAGQLALGSAGATTAATQAATQGQLGAGQLTLGGYGQAGQLGLGAGQLQLGAGQAGLQSEQAALQGMLGTGQLGLGAGTAAGQLESAAGQGSMQAAQGLLGEFNTQQQAQIGAQEAQGWLNQGAGYAMGNLGLESQQAALSGAGALYGMGTAQQGLAQEQLNIPYQMFQQQQAYPFQTAGWLTSEALGLGSGMGGASSTTYPGPSMFGQIAGAGLAGLGAYGLGSQMGWWGGGGGPQDFAANARGGRVGRAPGGGLGLPPIPQIGGMEFGSPGMGLTPGAMQIPGIPDVSISVIPPPSPLPAHSNLLQPTGSTANTTGGGPSFLSEAAGGIGAISGLAKAIPWIIGLFHEGGTVKGYPIGGGIGGGVKPGLTGGVAPMIGITPFIPSPSLALGPAATDPSHILPTQGFAPTFNTNKSDPNFGQPTGMMGSPFSTIAPAPLSIPMVGGVLQRIPPPPSSSSTSTSTSSTGLTSDQQNIANSIVTGGDGSGSGWRGGRFNRDVGGATLPTISTGLPAIPDLTSPIIPKLSLPTMHTIPNAPSMQQQPNPLNEGLSVLSASTNLSKLFTKAGDSSSSYQAGGLAAEAGAAATSGMSPMMGNLVNNYSSQTPEQLREMLARLGPGAATSRFGQAIQIALQQKMMTPQTPLGGLSSPPGGTLPPITTGLGSAAGGRIGFQEGGDIDPIDLNAPLPVRPGHASIYGQGSVPPQVRPFEDLPLVRGIAPPRPDIMTPGEHALIALPNVPSSSDQTPARSLATGLLPPRSEISLPEDAGLRASPTAPSGLIPVSDHVSPAPVPHGETDLLGDAAAPGLVPSLSRPDYSGVQVLGSLPGPDDHLPDPAALTGRARQPVPGTGAGVVGSGYAGPPSGTPAATPQQIRDAEVAAVASNLDSGEPQPQASREPAQSGPASASDPLASVTSRIYSGETANDPNPYYEFYGKGHFDPSITATKPGYFGFPAWSGLRGPTGLPTHAAGRAQWEPDTWRQASSEYVGAGHAAPDFRSPFDQEAVTRFWAQKVYAQKTGRNLVADAQNGTVQLDALAGQWPSLHGKTSPVALASSMPSGAVAAVTPTASTTADSAAAPARPNVVDAGYQALLQRILDQAGQEPKTTDRIMSSPWLSVLTAGLGMMASRSPYPGVAIGEGGLQGVKFMEQQRQEDVRARQVQNEATNRQAMLGIEVGRLAQQGSYQQSELESRRQGLAQQGAYQQGELETRRQALLIQAKEADQRGDLRTAQAARDQAMTLLEVARANNLGGDKYGTAPVPVHHDDGSVTWGALNTKSGKIEDTGVVSAARPTEPSVANPVAIREKALTALQNDPRWISAATPAERKTLLDETVGLLSPPAAAATPAAASDPAAALQHARDAIAAGASRDAVVGRLRQMGVDPSGL